MDSVFASTISYVSSNDDDRKYCIDLGLVTSNEKNILRPANAIYREVLVRNITDEIQNVLAKTIDEFPWSDGKILFVSDLLKEFQNFWRKGALSFPKHNKNFIASAYDEALYSFILEAFLQRIINGKGTILRQFAEGRGSVDIGITYQKREYIIEVKLKEYYSKRKSLEQLAGYLDSAGENEAWSVIFDRDRSKTWEDKITWNTTEFKGKTIHIVGC
jgi:hypothetical protein